MLKHTSKKLSYALVQLQETYNAQAYKQETYNQTEMDYLWSSVVF